MEEAAQILEIETFIPLLLQTSDQQGRNRLKRCVMIGDHHQLPPVIKNMAFQKYSNMEQALFTRLIRLGVPTIDLDAQGRARASLCSLYNWRYKNLGNLEHILQQREFKMTNAGFIYDYQLINVENFNDIGESEPIPYFYQVKRKKFLFFFMMLNSSKSQSDRFVSFLVENNYKLLKFQFRTNRKNFFLLLSLTLNYSKINQAIKRRHIEENIIAS